MPVWILESAVRAMHEEQIAEHGGLAGLRDAGALASALARPENLAAYGTPDLFDLAAAYAYGLARNHPFVDGNKRTSEVVTMTFLALNGCLIPDDEAAIVQTWLAIADGSLDEEAIAAWLRRHGAVS